MPFFVYGRDVNTGEVERRIISDAHSESEARAEAEAAGLNVTVVVSTHDGTTGARVLTPAAQASNKPTVDPVLVSENATFQHELREVTPNTYVTYTLVAANFLIFILMTLSGADIADPKITDLMRWGAEFGPRTLNGEPWRLFTALFVHIGLMHVASNMLVFAYVGPTVERMLGNIGFLLLYLISGLGGSLWALSWNPMQLHAGASGAIFGVYGALVAVLLREKDSVPPHVAAKLMRFVMIFVVYNLVNSLQPGISMAAHIGGLVTGFVCGLMLAQRIARDAVAARPVHDLMIAAFGGVLFLVGMAGAQARFPNLDRLDAALDRFREVELRIPKAVAVAESNARNDPLTGKDFADAINHTFLPDWRSVRQDLESAKPTRGPLLTNVGTILDYMNQRDESWQDLANAWRTGDDAGQETADDRMHAVNEASGNIRRTPLVHLSQD